MNKRQKKKQANKPHNQMKKMLKRSGRSKEFMVLDFSKALSKVSKGFNPYIESEKVFSQEHEEVDMLEHMKNNNVMLVTLPEIKSNIKETWKIPTCKTDGYKPVAFFYKNGVIDLDFFNEEKCDYLSEYDELAIEIEYPFIDGYKPTMMDWKMLGFDAHFE